MLKRKWFGLVENLGVFQQYRQLPVNCVYTGHYGTLDRKRMLEVIDEQIADLE